MLDFIITDITFFKYKDGFTDEKVFEKLKNASNILR